MNLNFYTATFPYGWGESYIEAESEYLCRKFDRICFFPLNDQSAYKRNLSPEFETKVVQIDLNGIKLSEELEILSIMISELFKSKVGLKWIMNWRFNRAGLKKAIRIANQMEREKELSERIHYSFWMNDWALALAVLKRRKKIRSFSFRVNGFDIYDHRNKLGYIPFRRFIYSQVSTVYTVSETARLYLEKEFKGWAKYKTAYFGTKDYGMISQRSSENSLRILSCSRLIPLKNVIEIAKSLLKITDLEIHWMHHGDGEEMEKLMSIVNAFPPNIHFIHSSFMDDHEAAIKKQMEFCPDVFISLSTSEGLPVTMLNALSFGIPIISTDVGGCKEIVNERTGILLPFPYKMDQVIASIYEINDKKWKSADKRAEIRGFWMEHFSAGKCYLKFAENLISEG